MISAIVLVSDPRRSDDVDHVHEIVVRSLVWLVSAVVAGVVRDVTLAGPADIGLAAVADQIGCKVVEADDEAERLVAAAIGSRDARLLVMRSGYQPDVNLTAEIEAFVRRSEPDAAALVLAVPEDALTRLLPGRAPVIGLLVPRAHVEAVDFSRLVRRTRRAARLRARATRIT